MTSLLLLKDELQVLIASVVQLSVITQSVYSIIPGFELWFRYFTYTIFKGE
jgi:hypothetical protein